MSEKETLVSRDNLDETLVCLCYQYMCYIPAYCNAFI